MNNWHNSLRKVKNCNKGKSGKKDFGLLTIKRSAALFREPSAENGFDPTSVCYMQYSIMDHCLNNFDIDYLSVKEISGSLFPHSTISSWSFTINQRGPSAKNSLRLRRIWLIISDKSERNLQNKTFIGFFNLGEKSSLLDPSY